MDTYLTTYTASSALLSDSYNHKVKVIKDPTDGEPSCSRLAGSGRRGYRDGPGKQNGDVAGNQIDRCIVSVSICLSLMTDE